MNKTVTMSDIAKDMGISTVSVSKAITGKDGVSKELREKILKRAAELGYQYNKTKYGQEKSSKNIGVLVAGHFINDDAFYAKIYQNIVMELTAEGSYGILEIVSKEMTTDMTPPRLLENDKVDGIILLGHLPLFYIQMLEHYEIPLVCLDFYDDQVGEDSVISDNIFGAYHMTRYLMKLGHKKISFIGSYRQTSSIMDRYIGYYKAMLQDNLPIAEEWIMEDRDADGNYIDITFPKDMPTAMVCNCDDVAFNVIRKLRQEGYRVPEDVSVVGFDNSLHAQLSTPQITTFDINADVMVQNAVDAILRKVVDSTYCAGRIVVTGSMVERSSATAMN